MSEPAKPLPCPFCGENGRLIKDDVGWFVRCDNLGCRVECETWAETIKGDAIAIWNHRAIDPRINLAEHKLAVCSEALLRISAMDPDGPCVITAQIAVNEVNALTEMDSTDECRAADPRLAELRAIAEGLAQFVEEDEDRIYDEVNKRAHNLTEAFTEWKARNPV